MFSDQSCVNQTETVHGTLRFLLLLSPIVWNMVKLVRRTYLWINIIIISKSYTMTKNTIDQQYTEQRQQSTIISYFTTKAGLEITAGQWTMSSQKLGIDWFNPWRDLSHIMLQWANIKKQGQGSDGHFHTNHCIVSIRALSWCLFLQQCRKGLLPDMSGHGPFRENMSIKFSS